MKNALAISLVLPMTHLHTSAQPAPGRYADINGLKLYYEIHGSGRALVMIHGGSLLDCHLTRGSFAR